MYVQPWHFRKYGATATTVRVTKPWGNLATKGSTHPVKQTRVPPQPPPTKAQMLARLRRGVG